MNFYKKYVLPKYLHWAMKNVGLEHQRVDVVSIVSGIGLEVGFGSGLNLPYYRNVTKLYALEPSVELFDLARGSVASSLLTVEHIAASAEHIPLHSSSLDFVVSTWTLCSIPHPEVALREIFRVLKTGGVFSFIEHGKSPKAFFSKIQHIVTPISKCVAGGCHLNRDIENLILGAGFEIQKLETFSQKSKPLEFLYKGFAIVKK